MIGRRIGLNLLTCLLALALPWAALADTFVPVSCALGAESQIPYIGAGGQLRCTASFTFDPATGEVTLGQVTVDAVDGENVIRITGNTTWDGTAPTGGEVILYSLLGDKQVHMENADTAGYPERVVVASPEHYEFAMNWGIKFNDITTQYGPLSTTTTKNFCMVRTAVVGESSTELLDGVGGPADVFFEQAMSGTESCDPTSGDQHDHNYVYALPGDPFIKQVWCTTNTNIGTGGNAWVTGDGAVMKFYASHHPADDTVELGVVLATLDFSFDAMTTEYGDVDRYYVLSADVNAYASDFFSGGLDPGDIDGVLVGQYLYSMSRAGPRNVMSYQCGMSIETGS